MKTIFILSVLLITSIINDPNQNNMSVKPEIEEIASLGEGALWDYKNNRLLWVDIEKGILNIYKPDSRENTKYDMGKRIGTVVPIDTGGVAVALEDGIYTYNFELKELVKRTDPENKPENRFNDGKCDPSGRFWAGTMPMRGGGKGALYQVDENFNSKKMIDEVSISNGIVWTPDKKKMYFIDTPTRTVVAYDYNDQTGEISSPKTIITVPENLGQPDGSTLDAEGKLWIGMWGGGCVTRWDPETGKLLQKIEVPAINVTSCAFGGPDLDILYITTASAWMNDEAKKKYPQAGMVFSVKPGVKGLKANYFKSK